MEILKFLSKEEKQKLSLYKNGNLNNITFGDDNTEMFFKWILYSGIYPPFLHIVGKEIRLIDGLFFTGKSKNGIKPSKLFPHNFDIFSLSKMDLTWEILEGKDILNGYNSKTAIIKSCMTFNSEKSKNRQELDFYVKNKNISLLVIKEKNKIVGRTLLWKSGNKTIHDRFYYHNPIIHSFLKMICSLKGFGNVNDIPCKLNVKLNYVPTMNVTFNKKNYSIFDTGKMPFLDSLNYFNVKTKELCLSEPKGKYIDLTDTTDLIDFIKDFSI